MKQTGILFQPEMCRANIEGKKTMTRRIVKPQPQGNIEGTYADLYNHEPNHWAFWLPDNRMTEPRIWKCPYGQIGDRIYQKETFWNDNTKVFYKADDIINWSRNTNPLLNERLKWKSSIFMPKRYARFWAEIVNIKVERVKDINGLDITKEGCPQDVLDKVSEDCGFNKVRWYRDLWNSLNEKRGYGWEKNDWVWVIEYKSIQKEQAK